jgi:tetratricopeptide (TPR) repeat protein
MRGAYLALIVIVGCTGPAWGQNVNFDDPPRLFVRKTPPTRAEIERRDSLYLYVQGLQCQREERFGEALKAFVEAARLDPDAPALVKAQVPILLGAGRFSDALAATQKIASLDPGDFQNWYIQAKLHKTLLKYTEAIAALEKALNCAAIPDHPEAAQGIYIELGELYDTTQKFGPAADAFNKAAALLEHPDVIAAKGHVPRELVLARASETYERIGILYRKAKRYDDAITAYRKAQERAPVRAALLHFTIAQVAEEKGDLKQALTAVNAYLATQPLSTEPHEMKVRLLRGLKQTDEIVPWLEAAAGRERFNTSLHLLLARELAAAKLPKKAEAIYTKLAEESPSVELYRGLFNIYKDEGPAGMARILGMLDKVMDKAAREDGPAPIGTTQRARAMAGALRVDGPLAQKLVEAAFAQKNGPDQLKFDTVYFLAALADKHRKTDEAERFYRHCLAAKDLTPENEAVLNVGLLRVLSNARRHEAAVKLCRQLLAKPGVLNTLHIQQELARGLAGLKRYDDALDIVDRSIKQAGDDDRFVFQKQRIAILSMAHRYDDAEADCKALLKTRTRLADAVTLRYLLSSIYSASKKQDQAQEQLQMILRIDPENATAHNDLGYNWADQGKNLENAEEMIRKAIDLDRAQRRRNPGLSVEDDKDSAAYMDSLGWVLFRRGRIDEARKELERATALPDGDDPVIYDHLGDVYQRLKMRPEATRAWQRALELYDEGLRTKDDERVRDIRRKIDQAKDEIGGR